jgi:lipopolysaccharide/colanic/teichoic acid biosynthesis glycosyltransferase
LKRLFDIFVVLLAAPVWLPLLALLALLVRWRLGAPVFFTQTRPGLQGRPFRLVKLRTMHAAHGPDGHPLPDAERLTPFGAWLRASSLDELPELWNVLRGDMSLVGPRPLLMSYLPLYSPTQRRRHEVLPGLTGWAQIHGRNDQTWEERFIRDVWYVDNRSLLLDLRILARTVGLVLRREGIAAAGEATKEPFTGAAGAAE